MAIIPDLNLTQIEADLTRRGVERVSFRAGQALQYEHQTPRGYFLPLRGTLRTVHEGASTAASRYPAADGPRLFPELGSIDLPLPYTLEAETDVTVWFFSRFVCEPSSDVMHCLKDLQKPANPLYKLWSHYVTTP